MTGGLNVHQRFPDLAALWGDLTPSKYAQLSARALSVVELTAPVRVQNSSAVM
jgi:hypothetical protein